MLEPVLRLTQRVAKSKGQFHLGVERRTCLKADPGEGFGAGFGIAPGSSLGVDFEWRLHVVFRGAFETIFDVQF